MLENSENRCLLKKSAQKRAGTGGRIAQSVEQGTENPRVPSSILGPATIFCFKSLIYNDLCIESTRKIGCFFVLKFSVWRIWRTGESNKTAEILRFALSGDTPFMLKYA